MANADVLERDLELLDPEDYPDRDSFIVALVVRLGWPASVVGGYFGLTARRVRGIAAEAPERLDRRSPILTLAELESMANDYRLDPYARPAEVDAAREWILERCRA